MGRGLGLGQRAGQQAKDRPAALAESTKVRPPGQKRSASASARGVHSTQRRTSSGDAAKSGSGLSGARPLTRKRRATPSRLMADVPSP